MKNPVPKHWIFPTNQRMRKTILLSGCSACVVARIVLRLSLRLMADLEKLRKEAVDYLDRALEGGPRAKEFYTLGMTTLRQYLFVRGCRRAGERGFNRRDVAYKA